MVQFHRFADGSSCLHKVIINEQKYSAWFHPNGDFKDGERTTNPSRIVPVSRRHVRIIAELERVARRFLKK